MGPYTLKIIINYLITGYIIVYFKHAAVQPLLKTKRSPAHLATELKADFLKKLVPNR